MENGIETESVLKVYQGRPNIIDKITNNEINLIINTPSGPRSEHDDSYIRKAAIKHKIPYITTMAAALAAVKGIEARKLAKTEIKSLQEYHSAI